jgi:hypothetical protein
MKALTLHQPFASAILLGYKKIETRSWKTNYRGMLAIHAAKGFPKYARIFTKREQKNDRLPQSIEKLSFGAIIGFVSIFDMQRVEDVRFNISKIERTYGDYSNGRWAWILRTIIPIEPISCRGYQRLWTIPDDILDRIATVPGMNYKDSL